MEEICLLAETGNQTATLVFIGLGIACLAVALALYRPHGRHAPFYLVLSLAIFFGSMNLQTVVAQNASIDPCQEEETTQVVDNDPVTPPVTPLFSFSDDFERADSVTLGAEWTDCATTSPAFFEPSGILNGGVTIPDPETRPGVYDTTPPSGHPPLGGAIHPGINCAYVETGTTEVSVKATWSGNHRNDTDTPPNYHFEGTPLLYVDPSHPRYGFGAWPSRVEVFGPGTPPIPLFLIGYIGGPPEDFDPIATAAFPGDGTHISGTPREIELIAEEKGMVTVWMDGEQLNTSPYGLDPIPVDPALIDSTLHGFAGDAHLVDPRGDIPTIKTIEDIEIKGL